jgi:hypothetical protein
MENEGERREGGAGMGYALTEARRNEYRIPKQAGGPENLAEAEFQQKLQAINRIHATKYIDEIILELPHEWCNLFIGPPGDLSGDRTNSIISKVKTGLNSFKDKLPISEQSIAGLSRSTNA